MSRDLYSAIHYILYQEESRLIDNLNNKYVQLRRNPFKPSLMLEYIKAEVEYQYFREYMKSLLDYLRNFI